MTPNAPFFARFLERQHSDGELSRTLKYPSDTDEDWGRTLKYPSDSDELPDWP